MTAFEPYLLLVVGVVAAVAVAYAAFYLLHGYRQKRLQARRGESLDPRAVSDRAYNRLALARREADFLSQQGADVEQARQLIDLAGHSLDRGEADRAYDLAQAAHETLVKARRGPLRSGVPLPEAGPPGPVPPSPNPALTLPSEAERNAATLKSRAEAQFQLRLFEQDLVAQGKGSPDAQPSADARGLYVQAHAAYARGDYSEAFRLSLRGRRRVGGRVESLGPSVPSPAAGSGGAAAPASVPSAEEVAGRERCPACGHPLVPGDSFCRGCGAGRTPSACPACGAPRDPGDSFCGKCGKRYS